MDNEIRALIGDRERLQDYLEELYEEQTWGDQMGGQHWLSMEIERVAIRIEQLDLRIMRLREREITVSKPE